MIASPVVPRVARAATPLAALAVVVLASPAAAGPVEVGGLLGPRRFSEQSILGANEGDGAMQTSLGTTLVFGLRVGKPLTSWLTVEGEVALTPATTRQYDLGVFWIEPRAHVRLQLPGGRVKPFVVLGGGMPAAISGTTSVYPSGVTGEGYGGAGVAFRPGRGIGLRLDLRVSMLPTRGTATWKVTAEGEVSAGLWFELGGKKRAPVVVTPLVVTPTDGDGDGVVDADDACPERPEDKDDFDDGDGCPDIDNDGDLVLDIADKCPAQPETYNGFTDDDGCADAVPPDVDGILGTIEGLNFDPGVSAVAKTAEPTLDMISEILKRHPGIRLVVVGHTDDVEAVEAATPPAEGEPPLDAEALSEQLGRSRAQAVRDGFVARGHRSARFVVQSAGAESPVSDTSPRGRARNRRVELRLFVPKRD